MRTQNMTMVGIPIKDSNKLAYLGMPIGTINNSMIRMSI